MKLNFRIIIFIYFSFFLSGCLGTRYLKDEERLLYRQKIEGNKRIKNEELENFYRQKPNRRIPLIPFSPYIYVYHFGLKHYDKVEITEEKEKIKEKYDHLIAENQGEGKKLEKLNRRKNRKIARKDKVLEEGNIWMRWGEAVTVFDSTFSEKTADLMRLYLNSKGFFNAQTDYQTKLSGKQVTVTYQINEGQPHTIDTIFYDIADTIVLKLINTAGGSLLEKGKNYDADKFSAERDRIDNLLKNNGYYDFSKQYIEFNIDTTLADRGAAVELVIHEPLKRSYHKIFKIDSVIFTTDANVMQVRVPRSREQYNRVTYQYFTNKYSKRILDRRLFIYPGDHYNKENTFETQRQLANLDMFKFINVYYDTTGNKTIAHITTSPLKKFQTSNEIGLTVSQNGFPGPFYNTTFKNRNIFGGMEILEISGRAGIEGVAAASDARTIYRSQEYGLNTSIIFPQFLFPMGERSRTALGRMNPRTRLLLGYTFVNRPDYQRENLKSSITYTWQHQQKVLYNFTLADVNLIDSRNISPEFGARLIEFAENGNPLIRAFEPSFVSSTIFTTTFNFNRYGSYQINNASFLKVYLESGGTTLNFFGKEILDTLNLQSFQFLKFNIDWRRYLPRPSGNTFAYRINVGVARPYGYNRALPYEKYFFAGGSNSLRAWRPRRLGPGSFTPLPPEADDLTPFEGPYDYRFEQPGDILLETSVEWRRNIIGFINGAVFVDAGNIWTFNREETRPGGKFELTDFYKEIAVGTGFGLRLDFSFLLVRLDVGTKVYDPARPEGSRLVLGKFGFTGPYTLNREPLIYNIGIGYPF
ncbi:BamA/TamA family outer membrane protein [soil metagenome]